MIRISLDENRSTGYTWESNPPPDVDLYEAYGTDEGTINVGGGGIRTLTYIKPDQEIVLHYRRPFDPDGKFIDSYFIARRTPITPTTEGEN